MSQEAAQGSALTVEVNPFSDEFEVNGATLGAPILPSQEPEKTPEGEATQAEVKPTEAPTTPTFDFKELGFENIDQLKSSLEEYKKLKEQPPTPQEPQFANEISKGIYQALLEGKESEVYEALSRKQHLDKLSSLKVETPDVAFEILKEDMKAKYPNLSDEQISHKLSKRYALPKEPVQAEGEFEEDFKARKLAWEAEVKEIQTDLIVDAEIAKPTIDKLKAEVVLPKFEAPQPNAANPQEAEEAAKIREAYLQTLESEANLFEGFKVVAKDEDIELPIAFNATQEEKAELKAKLENFDVMDYFQRRWFDDKGKFNTQVAMSDLAILEQKEKVLSKVANDAVSQFKVEFIKSKKNISLANENQPYQPQVTENMISAEQVNSLWS